ncbi:hypothetical protein NPIL_295041, partial [Nephila pilipes]
MKTALPFLIGSLTINLSIETVYFCFIHVVHYSLKYELTNSVRRARKALNSTRRKRALHVIMSLVHIWILFLVLNITQGSRNETSTCKPRETSIT